MKKSEKVVSEIARACVHPRVRNIGRKEMNMNKIITAGCVAVAAFAAVAMPNKRELADARRIVEDVTKADLAAFKAGKKPAKDVADAHISLAEKAENQAEKYLLYQGAFKLYTRSKEYDLAADTLQALQREIDDVPPKVIVEIVNREMRGITEKKAPRVFEILQQAKESSQSKSISVASDDVMHDIKGPYGILVQPDPGCEKGSAYALQKLKDVYLPRAKKYYGDPFLGKRPSRVYTIDVKRNDSRGNSYRPGTGRWLIGLGEGCDKFEMSLDYLAASVLTICEDANWASFVFYVNKFVEGDAKKVNPVPRLKKDIERGLSEDGDDDDNWYRAHAPLWAALEELRKKHPNFIQKYCALKNRRFAEGKLPKKLSTLQMAELLGEATGENAVEIFVRYGLCTQEDAASGSGKYEKQDVPKKRTDSYRTASRTANVGTRKSGAKIREGKADIDGYTWSYRVQNGGATIMNTTGGSFHCAVAPAPIGDITIPTVIDGEHVTGIGRSAFSNCRGLASVTIPESVTSIGMSAFYACWGVKSVTIPSSVRDIGSLAFYNSGLISVTIPEGVTSVGESAFGDCWGLKIIKIPSTVTQIGRQAFSCGGRLSSIVVSPRNPAFASVDGLLYTKNGKTLIAGVGGDVVIPGGVMKIGDSAFYKCSGLTSVALPSSIQEIGASAFQWCDSIMTFRVSPGNSAFASPNGLLCTKDGKTMIAGVNGIVAIPDGVESIEELAFSSRRGLTSVTLPVSMKKIGEEAFRCCSGLVSVTLRGNPPSCGKGVFDYCDKLTAIHVPPNAKGWAGMKEWQGKPLVFDVK